jgi:ATP-dependent Clp protease ATP-binding subunit ClpA
MLSKFTPQARRVLASASAVAGELGHGYVGTEHILFGLLMEKDEVAAPVLDSLGVTSEILHARLRQLVTSHNDGRWAHPPFAPRTKSALEFALRECHSSGYASIAPAHLLLGLLRDPGRAAQILGELHADADAIRRRVTAVLSGPPPPRWQRRPGSVILALGPTDGLRQIMREAAEYASSRLRSDYDIHDLVVALVRNPDAAPRLASLGVDVSTARRAIDQQRKGDDAPELVGTERTNGRGRGRSNTGCSTRHGTGCADGNNTHAVSGPNQLIAYEADRGRCEARRRTAAARSFRQRDRPLLRERADD